VTALLEVHGLGVRYGGVTALDDVSLRVEPGQIVGLIGPNGAGKTTAIDALTGFVPRPLGQVVFRGHDVTFEPAHRRVHRGMARTWQSGELFEDLTVVENLQVAVDWHSDRGSADIAAIARTLGLHDDLDRFPRELSHGHRKLVAVARSMASSPRLLLLDEPAAGLDAGESEQLGYRLRAVAREGIGVLLVDHDMGLVLSVCDYVYVLQFGRLIAQGTPPQVRTSPEVLSAYLGTRA
jgi:ABC-type branched-subunit amino acid transport system ATPase component